MNNGPVVPTMGSISTLKIAEQQTEIVKTSESGHWGVQKSPGELPEIIAAKARFSPASPDKQVRLLGPS
jgi:hypothetical protein